MLLQFSIHYQTSWGQQVFVQTNNPRHPLVELAPAGAGWWKGNLDLAKLPADFRYNYLVKDQQGNVVEELAYPRSLKGLKGHSVILDDTWRSRQDPEAALLASAFEEVVFKQTRAVKSTTLKPARGKVMVQLQLLQVRVPSHLELVVLGNTEALGKWVPAKALRLSNTAYPLWQGKLQARPGDELAYKYALRDPKKKTIVSWEVGPDRVFEVPLGSDVVVKTDANFDNAAPSWKGAGVAMPVFSLRTATSYGCGEFTDIKKLVDWAKLVGMSMVQILPVNDTIATYSWIDSYPYAAISVFALHPLYLNLDGLEKTINKAALDKKRATLNALPEVDYEAVLTDKLAYARQVYQEVKATFETGSAYQKFFAENEHWLRPYAAFSYLRDENKTANFNEWTTQQVYDEAAIRALTAPKSKAYGAIAFYYYLQFHLDQQLVAASEYARSQGVVLKGDIPIGIYRYSADAWVAPDLYNMDGQAGAPPDDFATEGQNWGFPTYDWAEMAKNDYLWWRQRFTQLSRYFDAFRIDHILGFFRIWETPIDQVEGIMGRFNPALPITINEFYQNGIYFDFDRFCRPYITPEIVREIFGAEAPEVIATFLQPFHDRLQLLPAYATQRQIQALLTPKQQHLQKGLFTLVSNVLFFSEEGSQGGRFHPRIDLQKTWSFRFLDGYTQGQLTHLYNDYFYRRQEDFWREKGMTKLPAMKAATNMLICGEDLGMVPACVPEVMKDLGILSLEIQRMPKNPKTEFLQARDIPYWSVCSPSTHDMSPLRLWWEEETPERRERFCHRELGWWGEAPQTCIPELAEAIIRQHLRWPAMWIVFPWQDMLAMDGDLRHPDPATERINIPAIIPHYWRYRMHLTMEELLAADSYNHKLREMLAETGRVQ
ncbi:MAG: 4-alpha-glucanotransferase [Bacteroidetes bacterium]|nr:MAG: 4-alpha-glucanotransferase [Bacteroidota bacterium]